MRRIVNQFRRTYKFPFQNEIPSTLAVYIKENNFLSSFFKFFKRYLYIFFQSQSRLELQKIEDYHKKILWINISAPSLGDSLMDLSSRVLLKGKKIDLLSSYKNSNLFLNDEYFDQVYSDKTKKIKNVYDLIIIDSYSTRSIKLKVKHFPDNLYVCMFGYFNGPEVNRVLFSFSRMNYLLGKNISLLESKRVIKPSIGISDDDINKISKLNLPEKFIAIAIGGEWEYRTYKKWGNVIEHAMVNYSEITLVLIGSENALNYALEITKKINDPRVIDLVNKLSFKQTAEVIKRARFLICCDGGLMHAANSVKTPIAVLFARLTSEMQLTSAISSYSLFDEENVNNIKLEHVLKTFDQAFDAFYKRPQDKKISLL